MRLKNKTTKHFKKNWSKYLLIFIIVLAFVLRIINLDRADMQGDDAVYSFMAIGYYDYLNSEVQTTPLQWYGYMPWWSKLSFNGHPPLVTLIQHLFFKTFGISTFVARLPFVIFGTLTVYALYLLAERLFRNRNLSLLAAFLLAISNYHIWISRTGYLEGILIFFIVLGLYLFFKLLDKNSTKNYILFGVSLGLAFMSKYTMLFFLPAIFLYLLFWNRKILFNKKILFTALVFLIVISPVIFYNLMVYKTRGHLDLQLSQLFGMDISKDWPLFVDDQTKGLNDYLSNFKNAWQTLKSALGNIYFSLFALALIVMIWRKIKEKGKNKKIYLIFLLLFFLAIQTMVIGPALRFISVFVPLIIICLIYFIDWFYKLFKNKYKYIFFILIVYLCCFSIFEAINTHWTKVAEPPYNQVLREENYGFRQLWDYFKNQEATSVHTLILYDSRLKWFSRYWYFYGDGEYSVRNYVSIEFFIETIKKEGSDFFTKGGLTDFYFLKSENTVFDSAIESNYSKYFENKLLENNVDSPIIIKRDDGEVAFKVYYFN